MKRRLTQAEPLYEPSDEVSSSKSMNDVTARIISSSVGSIITALAVTPLDVAKVKLQSYVPTATHNNNPRHVMSQYFHHHNKAISCCSQGCGALVWKESSAVRRNMSSYCWGQYANVNVANQSLQTTATANSREANTTWLVLRKIWMEEGISGLYRGIRPTLIMAVPNTMMYYTCYDELVQRVRQGLPAQYQGYAPLVSGGTARWLASTATAPLEYLRTREASLAGSTTTSVRQIIQTDGIRSLYRGLAPTLWRDVPFSAMYWLVIEELRAVWKHRGGGAPTNVLEQFMQSFVNGFVAGTISACCTTPFDVLKTRQQSAIATTTTSCTHNGATPFPASAQPSATSNTLRALQQLAQSEGIAGLWRGNWARTAKVAPSCAIMISSYEVGKRLLLVESPSS